MRKITIVAITLLTSIISFTCLAADVKYVTIGTSGSGGTYAMAGAAMAKVLKQYNPGLSVTIEATPGGGDGNIRLLGRGKIDLGLGTLDSAYSAFKREDKFAKENYDNLRTGIVGMRTAFLAIVRANSPIKSFRDLKGKKIASTSARSKSKTEIILQLYGLDKGDFKVIQYNVGECADALKDGNVDAIIGAAFSPVAAFLDLSNSINLRFLDHDPEISEKILHVIPDAVRSIIPANTYKGQTKDLSGIGGSFIGLFTHSKVDEQVVYSSLKTILEHSTELEEVYKPVGLFNLENQKDFINKKEVIPPLHPGMIRYFKDKGLLKK